MLPQPSWPQCRFRAAQESLSLQSGEAQYLKCQKGHRRAKVKGLWAAEQK